MSHILKAVLSVRAANCLWNEGPPESANWTEDQWKAFARSRTESQWLKTPNFGRQSLTELREWCGLAREPKAKKISSRRQAYADLNNPELNRLNRKIDKLEAELAKFYADRKDFRAGLRPRRKQPARAKDFDFAKNGWSIKQIALVRNVGRQSVKNNIIERARDLARLKIGPHPDMNDPNYDAAFDEWYKNLDDETERIIDSFPETSRFKITR